MGTGCRCEARRAAPNVGRVGGRQRQVLVRSNRVGDVVTAIDGHEPADESEQPAFLQPVGTVVQLSVKRGDTSVEFSLMASEHSLISMVPPTRTAIFAVSSTLPGSKASLPRPRIETRYQALFA
jgi:hypothetical protein